MVYDLSDLLQSLLVLYIRQWGLLTNNIKEGVNCIVVKLIFVFTGCLEFYEAVGGRIFSPHPGPLLGCWAVAFSLW